MYKFVGDNFDNGWLYLHANKLKTISLFKNFVLFLLHPLYSY